jgi:hypothetical protein
MRLLLQATSCNFTRRPDAEREDALLRFESETVGSTRRFAVSWNKFKLWTFRRMLWAFPHFAFAARRQSVFGFAIDDANRSR